MKKEINRYLLMTGIGCVIFGGLLLGSAAAMGGSPSFYIDRTGVHSLTQEKEAAPHVLEKTKLDSFTSADLYLDNGDLTILPSDGCYLEYRLDGQNPKPVFSVENETLTFREQTEGSPGLYFGFDLLSLFGSHTPKQNNTVTLYLPEDQYLESLKICSESGSVTADRLAGKELEITAAYGDLSVHTLDGEHAQLTCESGDLQLHTVKASNLYISNEYGDIRLENASLGQGNIQLESGSLFAHLSDVQSLQADNEYGDVSLTLQQPLSDYRCDLTAEYGSIYLPKATLKENGDQVSYTANTKSQKRLDITCESGDIQISER